MEIEKIELNPVQTQLLIKQGKVNRSEMMRLITLDLIMSGVLKLNRVTSLSSADAGEVYTYIEKGPNYAGFDAEEYQKPFLSGFQEKYPTLLSQYANLLNEKLGSSKELKRAIAQSRRLQAMVKSNWLNAFKLNDSAKAMGYKLEAQLWEAEKTLRLTETVDRSAAEILECLGNNIILIESYKLSELKELFNRSKKKENRETEEAFELEDEDFLDAFLLNYFLFELLDEESDFEETFEGNEFEQSFNSSFDSSSDTITVSSVFESFESGVSDFFSGDGGSDGGCSSCSSCGSD